MPDVGHTTLGELFPRLLLNIPPLVPELTIVTFGGGVTPLAKPVERTFWVLCIIKDLLAPELPSVSTFFNITEELHALSIISFAEDMLSKSLELAVTTEVIFEVVVCNGGLIEVTLKDTPDVVAFMFLFIMFLDTIALCKMFPVGKDFDDTLMYCVGVPITLALDVRVPKPMMVLAVPCDITVLIVPDLVLIGNLQKYNYYL